jgi:AcrR family transcriptional regulator
MADLLWGPRADGTRGPKAALDLDRIADAAIAVADAGGLAAVSMQRVAADLGFTKMALYRYVSGKNDLVAAMVERALGAPPDLGDASWRPGLRAWAHGLLAGHLRHPWTLEAVLLPRPLGPHEMSWMEAAAALVADTGLTGAERLDTLAVLVGQVRVIAQQARASSDPGGDTVGAIAGVLTGRADRFPALARTVAEAAADAGHDQAFDFGLDRILDGLQVLMDGRTSAAEVPPDRV